MDGDGIPNSLKGDWNSRVVIRRPLWRCVLLNLGPLGPESSILTTRQKDFPLSGAEGGEGDQRTAIIADFGASVNGLRLECVEKNPALGQMA
ncbi:hypothetical protein AVEN_187173-1 [Araneus ventricosus]|uniref:Uncharacterized protein n=1 Tax=Araneus ventricosus TaxID=182803 RepID=A0A4Y2SBC9_ARAVE|nr:hypothetical protein AVEN_187173-1 [Araneus ventricosus]